MGEMTHLPFRSGGGKRDAEKYFVVCGDPATTLLHPNALDVNHERAIVHALLADGIVRKNTKVVVKIGHSNGIRKDYEVGRTLRDIPGFLHAICLMSCKDDIRRYKDNPRAHICSHDQTHAEANVLVMPYIPLGSFRNHPWHERSVEAFQSCFRQLVMSLYYAFVQHGCLHTDIHLDNVLLKRTRKTHLTYASHVVPTHGIEVVIMDFENAFMPVDRKLTHLLFLDMARVVEDMTYTMRLRFSGQDDMERYMQDRKYKDTEIHIDEVLAMIERISHVQKEAIPVATYDPTVW